MSPARSHSVPPWPIADGSALLAAVCRKFTLYSAVTRS